MCHRNGQAPQFKQEFNQPLNLTYKEEGEVTQSTAEHKKPPLNKEAIISSEHQSPAKAISMLLFVTQELSLNKNRTHINEGKQHG